jgi:hypothetical protein
MAEEKEDEKDVISLKVGNLLPDQEAIVRFRFLTVLKLEYGAYALKIPQSFFPLCDADYLYSFVAEIQASSTITYVSVPENAETIRNDAKPNLITIERRGASGNEVVKDLSVFYRTANMEEPVALVQKSDKHPDEVALLLSFVPSFQTASAGLTPMETVEDEKPES